MKKGDLTGAAPPLGRLIFTGDGAWPTASALRLREETRNLAGLAAVQVEERIHPLWLRAGTADVERAITMLDLAASGLNCAHEPRRIVEIGAGAGYRSVALAAEYPGAEILAAEADPVLRRTGLLNTLAYGNITYVAAAVGAEVTLDGCFAQPAPPAGNAGNCDLGELLSLYHFSDADMLIITPDAAAARILGAPLPPALRLVAVETGGRPLPEDLARRYPLAQFVTVISGNYVLLYRRGAQRLPLAPRPEALLAFDGPVRYFQLENIEDDGFLHLPGGGVRLHPNPPGGEPARFILSAELQGHAGLQLSLRMAREDAAPVRFTIHIFSESGNVLASASETLRGTRPHALELSLPAYQGRCEAMFSAEMAEAGATNAGAWAEIVSATLI